MKVLCDCGAECEPSTDKTGAPEFVFPVASFMAMGRKRYELRALWYWCQACDKSYMVLPWRDEQAVVAVDEPEPFPPAHSQKEGN